MKDLSKELIDWAVKTIKKNFKEDVSLLVGHKHWKIPSDGDGIWFNYFIPSTDRGYQLSKTFIIDDIGYDLFPMSWERVEGLANLDESLATCLGEGVILYAKSDDDRKRFIQLQEKLKDNLMDKEYVFNKGLEKVNTAMELYKNMMFDDNMKNVRKASGYIANYLSQAVAMINGRYFERGPEDQISVMNGYDELPHDFTKIYESLIKSNTIDEIKSACHMMIKSTRDFFEERSIIEKASEINNNLEDLAAWYEEGVYTFRRIEYYSSNKDVVNSFAWGYNFQQEFDSIEEEFGLDEMDLMTSFDPDNLEAFRLKAKEIMEYIASVIEEGKVSLRKYDTLEEFLKIHG